MTTSFLLSMAVFILLVGGLGLWQNFWSRALRAQVNKVDRALSRAAQIAQRRHTQRFGEAHPQIPVTANGHTPIQGTPIIGFNKR